MPSIRAILKAHDHGKIEWNKLTFYRPDKQHRIYITDHRSYKDSEGIWHVFPLYYEGKVAVIACPYCNNLHTHGWEPGHRATHCYSRTEPGYILEVTPCPEYDFCAKRFGKETENV